MATERIACVMCGWWRTVNFGVDQHTGKPREIRFDRVDPASSPIWRLEKLSGAGKGSHDAKIELLDSKTLVSLSEDMKDQIKRQCERILEVLNEGPAPTPRARKPRGTGKTKSTEAD